MNFNTSANLLGSAFSYIGYEMSEFLSEMSEFLIKKRLYRLYKERMDQYKQGNFVMNKNNVDATNKMFESFEIRQEATLKEIIFSSGSLINAYRQFGIGMSITNVSFDYFESFLTQLFLYQISSYTLITDYFSYEQEILDKLSLRT